MHGRCWTGIGDFVMDCRTPTAASFATRPLKPWIIYSLDVPLLTRYGMCGCGGCT
jgi:hypothetical protein